MHPLMSQERDLDAEKQLLDLRTLKGESLDRVDKYKDQLVDILSSIKQEYAAVGGMAQVCNDRR